MVLSMYTYWFRKPSKSGWQVSRCQDLATYVGTLAIRSTPPSNTDIYTLTSVTGSGYRSSCRIRLRQSEVMDSIFNTYPGTLVLDRHARITPNKSFCRTRDCGRRSSGSAALGLAVDCLHVMAMDGTWHTGGLIAILPHRVPNGDNA